MAYNFPVAIGDVIEVTHSYVCLDQLLQYKFDILIGGTGPASDSDILFPQLKTDWQAVSVNLGASTRHVQTRLQKITDCVLGTTGKPKRVRGALDKFGGLTVLDGQDPAPFAPLTNTMSVQLITAGNPRQFWGKKGFGQLALSALGSDGEKVAALVRASWDNQCTTYFCNTHTIASTTLTYVNGILPTTYVANLPGVHAAMSTYFYPIVGVEVGQYLGTQKTRDIQPQATLGH